MKDIESIIHKLQKHPHIELLLVPTYYCIIVKCEYFDLQNGNNAHAHIAGGQIKSRLIIIANVELREMTQLISLEAQTVCACV